MNSHVKKKRSANKNKPSWGYKKQADHEKSLPNEKWPSCYSSPRSIDAWRHTRMLGNLDPLFQIYPDGKWMTVGDGHYGSDAYYLISSGIDALATSITDKNLVDAKKRGFLKKIRTENAESLNASDSSFDIILCKAAFHHFPRPAIAFYEMLRVAKKAVVLIEPQETSAKFLDSFKTMFKKVFRKDKTNLFEESGNYLYRTNVREVEKMMTALNHKTIAYKRFNDFFHPKISAAELSAFSPYTLITKIGIAVQDILCELKMLDYGLVCLIAFKEELSKESLLKLKAGGFKISQLPVNPYL
jgi:SAM-dependent methyltransferase